MIRFSVTVFLLLFVIVVAQAGPAANSENHVNHVEQLKLQCAACQFLGLAVAEKNVKVPSDNAVAHCLKFEGCAVKMSDCEIIFTLHSEIQKTPENFEKSWNAISTAVEKCSSNFKAMVISEDVSNTQCTLCFLVYDVLKYINYNILENPMLATVKAALGEACPLFNDDLCQALFQPDTFGAIIRGLQDSLGGFYDLIAVQGFQCPTLDQLFVKCKGQ
ncbi:Saposin B-type domain-containing protein [Caenorhabditis elegans]|uniref:Saposin B-type domain-containing protein n=1 Tax=Caenorhabditis elegans TaxID=6239 RepID=Q9TYK0_CAEEL|nr:Saposin B-type domain-containing protein [Caenorhabditis elegans]CCD73148.1 Saposin B-type domain-containing protein [Caenorhabditis elegans]|eukprot:NP_499928.1 Uncharacterized protein CELE_Y66H1A.5 [Caenorhabditis elegans]